MRRVKGTVGIAAVVPLTVLVLTIWQDGSSISFRLKKDTAMKKLMDGYCTKMGVAVSMQAIS